MWIKNFKLVICNVIDVLIFLQTKRKTTSTTTFNIFLITRNQVTMTETSDSTKSLCLNSVVSILTTLSRNKPHKLARSRRKSLREPLKSLKSYKYY